MKTFFASDLAYDPVMTWLVMLAEVLGHGRIVSTDPQDFNAYHWKNHEPFEK